MSIYCGDKPLPRGKRLGTRKECFVLGLYIANRKNKPKAGLRSVPGIGEKFAARLRDDYNINTVQEFIDSVRRVRGKKKRKEFLKKIFKGFQNKKKVVRTSFDRARDFLIEQDVDVAPMS